MIYTNQSTVSFSKYNANITIATAFLFMQALNSPKRGHLQGLHFATGSEFVVPVAADKNFYLRLTVEKMHVLAVFSDKYLQLWGCSNTSYTAMVNCANPKI